MVADRTHAGLVTGLPHPDKQKGSLMSFALLS